MKKAAIRETKNVVKDAYKASKQFREQVRAEREAIKHGCFVDQWSEAANNSALLLDDTIEWADSSLRAVMSWSHGENRYMEQLEEIADILNDAKKIRKISQRERKMNKQFRRNSKR